jgi:DNA-directed RNA polymerase subunit RPC12/RpoP
MKIVVHCGYCGYEFESDINKLEKVKQRLEDVECPKCRRKLYYFSEPQEIDKRLKTWGY